MKIEAFKMYLKPGCEEEYTRRHNEIWPQVKKLLQESGVYDYSIFLDRATNVLFAVQKVKGNQGALELGQTEIIQHWWEYMKDVMETNPDNSPVSVPLVQCFYME